MIFKGSHEVDSPEWWANRLHKELRDREIGRGWSQQTLSNERGTRPPLALLDAWRRNEPPPPAGADRAHTEAWQHVLRMTRTNAAELIVSSRTERIVPLGWTTAADADSNGDQAAEVIAKRNNLRTVVGEAIEDMLALGDGYLITTKSAGQARILRGSPFTTITAERGGEPVAALHLDHDAWHGTREAWLWLVSDDSPKGALMIARKERGGRYEWTDEGGPFPAEHFPVTRLPNKDGVGEFEKVLSDLARINDAIFNRVVLTKLQAHRQRALEKPVPGQNDKYEVDADIDPDDFISGPDALWDLPPGVKLWESATTDLTGVRSIVDDEFRIVASTTKTPIWVMLPGSQNQSATGSEKADSAFLSLVADRQHRVDVALSRVLANAFSIEGDEERADPTQISTLWAPQERYSLTEKAQALSQMYGKWPWEELAVDVMQKRPSDLPRLSAERLKDAFVTNVGAVSAGGSSAAPTAPDVPVTGDGT